ILVYADALAQQVDQRIPLPPGSEDEVEIRAGTIWGVEELRLALSARGVTIPAYQLDWQLWELGQSLPSDTKPYHLTRTVYY
ncbi:MAG TPA: queuosine salvage family protein, partial [Chloroflexota bacterium]